MVLVEEKKKKPLRNTDVALIIIIYCSKEKKNINRHSFQPFTC